MRLPIKRGFDIGRSVPIRHRSQPVRHHVVLWQQPWHRWAAAVVYHWYDMRVYKLPGFRLLERFKRWRWRNRDLDFYLPIAAEQDCRCYFLSEKQRTVLAVIEVDEATYDKLKPS